PRAQMHAPDFAIIGAPKCGTSSLHATVEQHPDICMSYVKEPHFFAFDLPGCRDVADADAYRRLFRLRRPGQLRGETSVFYLYSSHAVPAMLRQNPKIKIIT